MRKYSYQLLVTLMTAAVLLTFVLWIGCERTAQSPVEPLGQQQGIVLNKANPMVQTVINIQNDHTQKLMKIPGVVGTGTGLTKGG